MDIPNITAARNPKLDVVSDKVENGNEGSQTESSERLVDKVTISEEARELNGENDEGSGGGHLERPGGNP